MFYSARDSNTFNHKISQGTLKLRLSDPSDPQFEPVLAWLDTLRKVYERTGEK